MLWSASKHGQQASQRNQQGWQTDFSTPKAKAGTVRSPPRKQQAARAARISRWRKMRFKRSGTLIKIHASGAQIVHNYFRAWALWRWLLKSRDIWSPICYLCQWLAGNSVLLENLSWFHRLYWVGKEHWHEPKLRISVLNNQFSNREICWCCYSRRSVCRYKTAQPISALRFHATAVVKSEKYPWRATGDRWVEKWYMYQLR